HPTRPATPASMKILAAPGEGARRPGGVRSAAAQNLAAKRFRRPTQNPSRTAEKPPKFTSPRHAEPARMSREMSVPAAGIQVMDQSRAPAYRLVRRPLAGGSPGPEGTPGPPRLDQAQQQVGDHAGGPLLVLAGPGTGKTTTIVAAVADRIEKRGI